MLITEKRQVHVTDKRVALVASTVGDVFQQMHLTVVCIHCGGTPRMANHPSDANWRMDCDCTTRRVVNPSPIITPERG